MACMGNIYIFQQNWSFLSGLYSMPAVGSHLQRHLHFTVMCHVDAETFICGNWEGIKGFIYYVQMFS